MLRLFDVEVEIHWPEASTPKREPVREVGASPVLAGIAG
jgi:hypothetical protein